MLRLFLGLVIASAIATDAMPNTPKSFTTAKAKASLVTAAHRFTLYCGCSFNSDNELDIDSCGYEPRNMFTFKGHLSERWQRTEWEHVVPASRLGKGLKCWEDKKSFSKCRRKSGKWMSSRECCRAVNPRFRRMETDLHNLWPAVGEINGDRSNRAFGRVAKEPREYGHCDFEVSKKYVEAPEQAKGEVARTYLYMNHVWNIGLTNAEKRMFARWNREDPPSRWELERDRRISVFQGLNNKFVVNHTHVSNGDPCTPRKQCCKVCSFSEPCGNSCISEEKMCTKDPGCSCAEEDLCPE